MKIITNIDEIKNKVIKEAVFVDCDSILVILFDDDTCVCLNVDFCGGSHSIELSCDIEDYEKKNAGIITEEQYNNLEKAKKEAHRERVEKEEMLELARLKQKYKE